MRKILFFTLLFGVAQSQPVTTYSNVKIYDGMNTTYRDLGSKSVGGISTGQGSSSNSFGVRVVGGHSTATTFVNPNATINAVPESAGQVRVAGQINYNNADIQKAWKANLINGLNQNSAKGSGWLLALQLLPEFANIHSTACLDGRIDFLCWGRLKKIVDDSSIDVSAELMFCEKSTGHSCFFRDDSIFYISFENILDQEAMSAQSDNSSDVLWTRSCPSFSGDWCNGDGAGKSVVRNGYWTYDRQTWIASASTNWEKVYVSSEIVIIAKYDPVYINVETETVFCSIFGGDCSSVSYIEQFVPFTPQDLEHVDLPMESMSDADFALVQDSIGPTTITLEPINTFTYDNVVTTYDKDGNKIDVHTTTTAAPTINNNNTSSPTVDTQVTTKQDTYTNGSLTGSTSSTTVVNGNTTNNYYQSEYDKSDLTCKGSNCSGQGIKTPTNSGNITSSNQLYQPKNTDELPDFILSKVPTVDNSKIASELEQLIPNLPVGSCPTWVLSKFEVMGVLLLPPTPVNIPCWIYDLIGAFIMISAVVYSRTIIMGA